MPQKNKRSKVFSALEVANICGVVNQTAINWIKAGHLKAYKTPGGQFRVTPENLAEFMEKRGSEIPESLKAILREKQFQLQNRHKPDTVLYFQSFFRCTF